MNKKMMIAGMLVGVLMFSTLGIVAMAQETTDDVGVSQEVSESQNELFLITPEQGEEIRTTVLTMQEEHATRTEIRETTRTMSNDFINANLESYGLTEVQIDEIESKILEINDKMDEIRETAVELRAQDINRMDVKETIKPLMEEVKVIRDELKVILDSYDIIPLEMRGPGRDEGPGMGEGHGPGQDGRPGRFGGGPRP